MTHEFAARIGQEYCEHVRRSIIDVDEIGKNEMFRFTDKMPTNFWHMGLIARVLPNAKIIHVRRDPMDVFVSCFKQNLTWPFCDLQAIVRYHAAYLKIMEYWNLVRRSLAEV
ncbi:sulfotransferase family protein [Neorhodopirellula pilleata]|uniref:sulfotransferase family protein n=1 Tax=Neorhodopirellula pilleata TaxID=2714738 RepID=UPI001E391D3D|nr:sulfotransferase [Neorhodopirellula pilleata]